MPEWEVRSCLDRFEQGPRCVDRGLWEVPPDAGLGGWLVSGGKRNALPTLKAPLTRGGVSCRGETRPRTPTG